MRGGLFRIPDRGSDVASRTGLGIGEVVDGHDLAVGTLNDSRVADVAISAVEKERNRRANLRATRPPRPSDSGRGNRESRSNPSPDWPSW